MAAGVITHLLVVRWLILVLFSCLLNTGVLCFSEEHTAVQFFLKTYEQGFCGREAEIEVFALDSYGLIAKDYEGIKQADIQIKEIGGRKQNSLSVLSNRLEFSSGQAKFMIVDSEPENVEVRLSIDSLNSPFAAKINFKEKSHPAALQLKLSPRGVLNQPVKAQVMAVDKKGNLAVGYSQRDIAIRVIERGAQDKSFQLQSGEEGLVNGGLEFTLLDSEEEELAVYAEDPKGALLPAESRIIFSAPDTEPPQITEIKMETLAFVELTFNETLDDASATDANNYEVVCFSAQHPRSVELHNNKVVLELEDLLRPHDTMYVSLKNIKDLSGNLTPSDYRSPNYSVPYEPLHLELKPSLSSAKVNNPITISITVRCVSGRVPKFINGKFIVEATEGASDASAHLSSSEVEIQKGIGEFSITDSSAEKVRLTIRDPENAVEPASVELEFI